MENFENISENIRMLFVSYLTGKMTTEELQELQDWLSLHPDNKKYLDHFAKTWEISKKSLNKGLISDELQWNNLQSKIAVAELQLNDTASRKVWFLPLLKVAASWVLIFGLGAILSWLVLKPSRQNYNALTEITSPLGAKSHVKLPDGTEVWLNAGSKIVYSNSFNEKERKVYLTGEAFFDVFTNKTKPFTVQTSDIVVRAFGTKFNVKAYPDEKTITTTLEEGKIDVMVVNEGSKKLNPIILQPKQKVVYYKEDNVLDNLKNETDIASAAAKEVKTESPSIKENIAVDSNINTELYTSWKEKEWIIERIPFESLVPMLERKFNMKITFKDPELKSYKFTGTIQNETIDQIMEALRYTAPMDYKIVRDTIILTINQKLKNRYKSITKP